jgi:hypothetical protein
MHVARWNIDHYEGSEEGEKGVLPNGVLNDPYEHMCLNCEKMTKEMVRQGRPKDNIVKAFSAPMWEWNRPRDGRWPHLFRT